MIFFCFLKIKNVYYLNRVKVPKYEQKKKRGQNTILKQSLPNEKMNNSIRRPLTNIKLMLTKSLANFLISLIIKSKYLITMLF